MSKTSALRVVGDDAATSPAVVTIALPVTARLGCSRRILFMLAEWSRTRGRYSSLRYGASLRQRSWILLILAQSR